MAQNKPTDGQGMAVDLAPTVRVVEAKLTADIDLTESRIGAIKFLSSWTLRNKTGCSPRFRPASARSTC